MYGARMHANRFEESASGCPCGKCASARENEQVGCVAWSNSKAVGCAGRALAAIMYINY
jgi:hypothetical protein